MFLLALCKRSQANCFQMEVCGGHIYHSTEGEERAERGRGRKNSRGLSKAFCSTDEGISCLDLGGLSICAWGVFEGSACGERDKVQIFLGGGILCLLDLHNQSL